MIETRDSFGLRRIDFRSPKIHKKFTQKSRCTGKLCVVCTCIWYDEISEVVSTLDTFECDSKDNVCLYSG